MKSKIYRCPDGSEVHEMPAPFEVDHGLRYEIQSPTWRVYGGEDSQAHAIAMELKGQWEAGMERAKAHITASLNARER